MMSNQFGNLDRKITKAAKLLKKSHDPEFSARVMSRLKEARVVPMQLFRSTMEKVFPYVVASCLLILILVGLQLLSVTPSTDLIIGIEELSPDDAIALIEN